jgi:hypothetical protein
MSNASAIKTLVAQRPRAVAAALIGGGVATAVMLWSPWDDTALHLQRPRGVRPIVLSIPDGALPPGAPQPSVPKYDARYANAESAALEQVRSRKGKLAKPFKRVRKCSKGPCVETIVVKSSGAIAFDGARWAEGYIPTGRGEEVVRLRPPEQPQG